MLCESCPRLFKGNLSLQMHVNLIHKGNHACKICEEQFENLNDMRIHKNLFHTSEKITCPGFSFI